MTQLHTSLDYGSLPLSWGRGWLAHRVPAARRKLPGEKLSTRRSVSDYGGAAVAGAYCNVANATDHFRLFSFVPGFDRRWPCNLVSGLNGPVFPRHVSWHTDPQLSLAVGLCGCHVVALPPPHQSGLASISLRHPTPPKLFSNEET
jgi:hypothetical protein